MSIDAHIIRTRCPVPGIQLTIDRILRPNNMFPVSECISVLPKSARREKLAKVRKVDKHTHIRTSIHTPYDLYHLWELPFGT